MAKQRKGKPGPPPSATDADIEMRKRMFEDRAETQGLLKTIEREGRDIDKR